MARTPAETTPAVLDHADTTAKARLHHPAGIDTSIVPLDGNGTRKAAEGKGRGGGDGGAGTNEDGPRPRENKERGGCS